MTMISYFSFSIYGHLWLKQPGLEWVSPLCFACIIYSSCIGMSPIPFIISFEIYPTKVQTFLIFKVKMSSLYIAFSFGIYTLYLWYYRSDKHVSQLPFQSCGSFYSYLDPFLPHLLICLEYSIV